MNRRMGHTPDEGKMRICFYATDEQKKMVEARANALGLSVSDYLRGIAAADIGKKFWRTAVNRPGRPSADDEK